MSWEYEGPSELQSAGIRHSPSEVAEYFNAIANQFRDHILEMTESSSSGDTVAAFGRYQGTIKETGIRVDTPIAHYFKFRDGKMVRVLRMTNTAAFWKRFADAPLGQHLKFA